MTIAIRLATPADAAAVAAVYNPYVLGTAISFEEEAVPADVMAARIAAVVDGALPWLVATTPEGLAGFAHASRWKDRNAYRFTVETTVYVAPGSAGRGVGSALYGRLFERLRGLGYHSAIAVIALPNPASVALHEKFGMVRAGLFREVGFKFDAWHDVGHWQCAL